LPPHIPEAFITTTTSSAPGSQVRKIHQLDLGIACEDHAAYRFFHGAHQLSSSQTAAEPVS
jgi:hypothetical protein